MFIRTIDMTPTHSREITQHSTDEQYDAPPFGCVYKTLVLSANGIHFIQVFVGVSAVSYAIAISFHGPDPQKAIATILNIFGCLLIASSLAGFLGITKAARCNRISLKMSRWMAPIIGLCHMVLAVLLISEETSFLRYITEKEHQLFLTEKEVDFITTHMDKIYAFLFVAAFVEVLRFYLLSQLRDFFVTYDEEYRRFMLENHALRTAAERRRWQENPRDEEVVENNMMEPLLSEVDMESENVSLQNQSDASRWWEEPDEEEGNIVDDKKNQSGGSWMSRVFKGSNHGNESKEQSDESSSSINFEPVDASMDHAWNETCEEDEEQNGPDLSWAKDD